LQDATQEKVESVEEFADRCRRLCLKTIWNVAIEATQSINEEAERRLVAAYINGLEGVMGQQVRFRMPLSLKEAVQVAVTVSNAERMRAQDTKRVFSAKKDNSSQGVTCGKRATMLGTVGPPKEKIITQGIVAPIMRQQAEGRPRPIRRREIPLPRATQAGNIFGVFIVKS
jgi:hypothetical protein